MRKECDFKCALWKRNKCCSLGLPLPVAKIAHGRLGVINGSLASKVVSVREVFSKATSVITTCAGID